MPDATFAPDSPLVPTVVPSLGLRDGKLAARTAPVAAIVVHTTGGGPVKRFADPKERAKFGYASPFDAALRIYRELMEPSPHYVVGQDGQAAQVVPEGVVAWHVGGSGAHIYDKAGWGDASTKWWPARWTPLKSPFELAGGELWAGGSCNANTIGIEVVPPATGATAAWSDAAWSALVALVKDVAQRRGVPVDVTHVVTHSDAHPLARSTKAGAPWDPGPKQWSWDRFAKVGGVR